MSKLSAEASATLPEFNSEIELIGNLPPFQQDWLGLITLGMSDDYISDRADYTIGMTRKTISQMYKTLELDSTSKRPKAKEVSWSAGLLEIAHVDQTGGFHLTKKAFSEENLTLLDAKVMDELKLILDDYRILQLVARSLTTSEICEISNKATSTIQNQVKCIRDRNGGVSQNELIAAVAAITLK
jgi:DNA-binding CsgD family transcriptional regulator